jgi:hypothetical protein
MKLIAHRGWAAGASENTLAAFARAAQNAEVAGIEFTSIARRNPARWWSRTIRRRRVPLR